MVEGGESVKKYLLVFLLLISVNCFAGTGAGIAIGAATGMAIANASDNTNYQIKIELCKTKNNQADIQQCLLDLQKEKNNQDRNTIIFMLLACACLMCLLMMLNGR
jgi:hypothetical protein